MWKRGHSRQAPSNTKSQRLEWPLLLKPDPPSPYGAAFVHSRLSHPRPSGFPSGPIGEISGMANVRLIKHEAVPNCGSCEVRFPDGGPSKYFYWDDLPSRRLRPDLLTSAVALEQAKAFARAHKT